MENGNKIFMLSLFFLSLGSCQLFPALENRNRLMFFFDKIEVSGDLDVFVKKGPKRGKVSIYADGEIIDSVSAKVSQKTLFLDANNSFEIKKRIPFIKVNATRKFPVEVMVYVEEISELRIMDASNLTCSHVKSSHLKIFHSSTGNVHIESVNSPEIKVQHIGSGQISLQGKQTSNLEVEVRGNGMLNAGDLEVKKAKVVHYGNSEIALNPAHWLDVRLLSSGNIFLHQNPINSVINLKGTGKIKHLFAPELRADVLPE